MQSDELVQIFFQELDKADSPHQSEKELVHEVVSQYLFHLMNRGNIPERSLLELQDFIEEETWEIYRKTTYGHLSLQSYRKGS